MSEEKIVDGGSAFPEIETDRECISDKCATGDDIGRTYSYGGMTLRDWFAGQAIAGYTSNPEYNQASHGQLAIMARDTADAMIAWVKR